MDTDAIIQNKRAYKKAWEDCKDRMHALVQWYIDLGANQKSTP